MAIWERPFAQTGRNTWFCPSLRESGMPIERSQLNRSSIDPKPRNPTVRPYAKSRPTALALAANGSKGE